MRVRIKVSDLITILTEVSKMKRKRYCSEL